MKIIVFRYENNLFFSHEIIFLFREGSAARFSSKNEEALYTLYIYKERDARHDVEVDLKKTR